MNKLKRAIAIGAICVGLTYGAFGGRVEETVEDCVNAIGPVFEEVMDIEENYENKEEEGEIHLRKYERSEEAGGFFNRDENILALKKDNEELAGATYHELFHAFCERVREELENDPKYEGPSWDEIEEYFGKRNPELLTYSFWLCEIVISVSDVYLELIGKEYDSAILKEFTTLLNETSEFFKKIENPKLDFSLNKYKKYCEELKEKMNEFYSKVKNLPEKIEIDIDSLIKEMDDFTEANHYVKDIMGYEFYLMNEEEIGARIFTALCECKEITNLFYIKPTKEDLEFFSKFEYDGKPIFGQVVEKYKIVTEMRKNGVPEEEINKMLENGIIVYKGKVYKFEKGNFNIIGEIPEIEYKKPKKSSYHSYRVCWTSKCYHHYNLW